MRRKKPRKKKLENVDGLGPKDVKRLVTAIRKVWGWNYARRLCLERAVYSKVVGEDPTFKCEKCFNVVPKVYPDHIRPVGEFSPTTFIIKMFVDSFGLQALCKKCHQAKTNMENAVRRRFKSNNIDLGF